MSEISVMGIDLAKAVFHIHGRDQQGKTVVEKRLSRGQLRSFVHNSGPCLVGMEACGGSHYWAREFQAMGHQVKLMSPQFVRPYVKSNKNDWADAAAIAEAVTRPGMRFVPIKQVAHQDIQCLHRVRERLARHRTSLSNEIRGLLQEYGIVLPQSIAHLKKHLPRILEDAEQPLSEMSRTLFSELSKELRQLDEQVDQYDVKIQAIFASHEVCQRIGQIEGIGPITATALYAAVGDPHVFHNGRQFAAWLGLVPRQASTGGKTILRGISKRGDRYLRTLLVHGARAALRVAPRKLDARSRWAVEKQRTRGTNKACVAIANKNARIAWALMTSGERYRKAA